MAERETAMRIQIVSAAAAILLLAACSSGPTPPQPGTPEFAWAAAKTTYASGDYLKAYDNLSQLAKGDSELAAKAKPLAIVLSAGIAKAYTDLAQNFDWGAQANRANPAPFQKQMNYFRSQAASTAVQTVELVHAFVQSKPPDSIVLAFGYPAGTATPPVQLQRVSKGMIVPDAEIEALSNDMVKRSVLLTMTKVVGAGEDTAKALEIFKQPEVSVPRSTFVVETSKALCDMADLFSPKKLDQPNRLLLVVQGAEEAVGSVPASKDTKDLSAKLAKLKKPLKKT
jgi:hypothetical protein